MKKALIFAAALAVMGIGTAAADDYWSCVANSTVEGARGGSRAADELGIGGDSNAGQAGRWVGAGSGAIGGAAAGLTHCGD